MEEVRDIAGQPVHIEGSGPTVVLMHGWPDTYRLWDGTVAALKDSYRCVRYTWPGFDPASPRKAYTLEEAAAILKVVIDTVAPGEKVTLLAHDWGCMFAYDFHNRHPDRIARVIGVDIGDAISLRKVLTPKVGMMIMSYQTWNAAAWAIGGGIGDWMCRFMARRLKCPSDLGPVGSQMCYPYWMTWFAPREIGYRGRIKAFQPKVPMLFVYARRKPFMFHAQSWLDELRAANPKNRIEEFDCGHWIMTQQQDRFAAVVKDWLKATA